MLFVLIKGIKRQSPRHEIKSAPWPGLFPMIRQIELPFQIELLKRK